MDSESFAMVRQCLTCTCVDLIVSQVFDVSSTQGQSNSTPLNFHANALHGFGFTLRQAWARFTNLVSGIMVLVWSIICYSIHVLHS